MIGNNLGLIIALIGSGASTMLALILPPLMDIVDQTNKDCSRARVFFHSMLALVGIVFAGLGVFVSAKALF
jgi:hypothetical protein